eukprot:403370310
MGVEGNSKSIAHLKQTNEDISENADFNQYYENDFEEGNQQSTIIANDKRDSIIDQIVESNQTVKSMIERIEQELNSHNVQFDQENRQDLKELTQPLHLQLEEIQKQIKVIQTQNNGQEDEIDRIHSKSTIQVKIEQLKKQIAYYKEKSKALELNLRVNQHQEIQKHSNFIGKLIQTQKLKESLVKLRHQSPSGINEGLNHQYDTPMKKSEKSIQSEETYQRLQMILEKRKLALQMNTESQIDYLQKLHQRYQDHSAVMEKIVQAKNLENQQLKKEMEELRQLIPEDKLKQLDPYSDAKIPRVAGLFTGSSPMMLQQSKLDRKLDKVNYQLQSLMLPNKSRFLGDINSGMFHSKLGVINAAGGLPSSTNSNTINKYNSELFRSMQPKSLKMSRSVRNIQKPSQIGIKKTAQTTDINNLETLTTPNNGDSGPMRYEEFLEDLDKIEQQDSKVYNSNDEELL